MDATKEMMAAINARSEAERGTRVATRMAMAKAAHCKKVHEQTLADLVTILTLNAGFLGIIIFMALMAV